MTTRALCLPLLCVSAIVATAADYKIHTFEKTQLTDKFWSEGATFGDLNKDGKNDIISGPYWWEGPDFKVRHEYYQTKARSSSGGKAPFTKKDADGKDQVIEGFEGGLGAKNAYSDNFFAYVHDFNGDGWNDILIYGFPGQDATWYENPKGKKNAEGTEHWPAHRAFDVVDNESPTWGDLTGDGKPEIVCNSAGYFGYATPDWKNPTEKWTFHPISPKGNWQRFTHGLGMGDVNGDGRQDVLFKDGWWEQPASLAGDPEWKLHKEFFGTGGAQMYVYDVNGDGMNDVITSLAAHGFGLAWYEQYRDGDDVKFRSHTIMNKEANENRYGLKFAQLHAIDLIDMDDDGVKDIVTGKRFWAHGPTGDIEANADPVTYYFKITRGADKKVDFVPCLIANDVGVGTQVVAGDINGDKLPDVVVGNKRGTFVLMHRVKNATKEEWEKAQPKVLYPEASAGVSRENIVPHTNPQRAAAAAAAIAPAGKSPFAKREGAVPTDKDGRTLNLSFEDGSLKDWIATGDAFKKQPVKGDTVVKRLVGTGRADRSDNEGEFWVGGFETGGDNLKGTLASAPFKVTQPFASFLVGGGQHDTTRVELVRADTQDVIFTARGINRENMRPVVADLQPQMGKEIFIRVVDEQTGPWGHINFDDFRFHARKPVLTAAAAGAPPATPAPVPPSPADDVKFSGLSPEDAAKEMTVPKGFKAHLFAGEPDVKQPIAFTIDDRGRLWVVENYTYPHRQPDGEGKDRILVYEDTNGDHKFDRATVFIEGLNLATGIEYGFGGVWVGAAPYLYFIPVKEGDAPKPAGKPQIMLEGFAWHDTHEMLNTFAWGPDGWLYGCHGVFTHSHVKRPDQPDSERQFLNAGVWRFHPVKHTFEVFAEGTSNPWGIDFNQYGHCFVEACVIPHLFHIVQGARYHRQAGQHYAPTIAEANRVAPAYFKQAFGSQAGQPDNPYTFKDAKVQPLNPYIYDDIKTIADHRHYLGATPHSGNGRSDAAGGGHAHAGLMCYLGGSWPAEYTGKLFMNNIHGQRLNMDILERTNSGYVGKHGDDLLNFNDRWSQIINLRYDQDGSVYLIDWYDKQQCHNQKDASIHDRSNGRIFKLTYGDAKASKVNLGKMSDVELAKLQTSKNEWHARQSRRLLMERAVEKKGVDKKAAQALQDILAKDADVVHKLRALWTLHVIDVAPAENLFRHENEIVRAWATQLACEDLKPTSAALQEFARMAKEDPSAHVRLYLASACQRLSVAQRLPIVEALIAHAEDAPDQNLPLMYWYAMEPIVGEGPAKAVGLLGKAKIPVLREYITRRMAAGNANASGGQ